MSIPTQPQPPPLHLLHHQPPLAPTNPIPLSISLGNPRRQNPSRASAGVLGRTSPPAIPFVPLTVPDTGSTASSSWARRWAPLLGRRRRSPASFAGAPHRSARREGGVDTVKPDRWARRGPPSVTGARASLASGDGFRRVRHRRQPPLSQLFGWTRPSDAVGYSALRAILCLFLFPFSVNFQ
jgi:hypothetical protein